MKFTLVVWICSFLNGQCSPPILFPNDFNTWGECVAQAHIMSYEILTTHEDIDKHRLATKYMCKEENVI